MSAASKVCHKCKELKDASQFGRSKQCADGLYSYCKACERVRSVERKAARNADPAVMTAFLERRRLYSAVSAYWNADGIRARAIAKAPSDSVKRSTHVKVSKATKSGRLIRKSCEICGETRTHAHHDDYAKPLDVRWLCSVHHADWHLKNGPGINGEAPISESVK